MRKRTVGSLLFIAILLASCQTNKKQITTEEIPITDSAIVLTDSLRFCEATYWNGESLYVGSFGGEELNPLNNAGKGYVVEYKEGKASILIPADGKLNAPKGMCVVDNHLFIADVGAVMVYNLADISKSQKISFPQEELFINDLATDGTSLYITVTNTGHIYKLNISVPAAISDKPMLFAQVPGANGIVLTDSIMYIASYPPDGNTSPANVIYTISNFEKPVVNKLFKRMGQYDGLALSEDGNKLFFTTWVNGGVGAINLTDTTVTLIDLPVQLAGPAELSLHNGKLYIPDLPNSRIIISEE